MKPERIQLGLKSLIHWRRSAEQEQAIVRQYQFVDLAAAGRFLRESLELAEKQQLAVDLHLQGSSLSGRLPDGSDGELEEHQLFLAGGIESRALGVTLEIRDE